MLEKLRQKAKSEATLKPPRQILAVYLALAILIGTILIIVRWGVIAGIAFFVIMLVVSFILSAKFNI